MSRLVCSDGDGDDEDDDLSEAMKLNFSIKSLASSSASSFTLVI